MKVIVGCFIEDNGKYLMVQEKSKLWNYPGGHLEDNETIIEGAIRETYEETGYNVEIVGVLPIEQVIREDGHVIVIKFVGKIISFNEEHKLDDVLQARWMSSEEILNLDKKDFRGYDSNRRFLKNYLDNNVYPVSIFNK